ncbi:MAG TPA: hypothetical protein VGG87_06730 [Solirubrobacteraceae bacterium]
MEITVRSRISLVVAVSACALFVAGAGMALAAKASSPRVVKCHMYLSAVPGANSAQVDQPPSGGRQYGPAQCAGKGLGSGVEADKFTVPISGDLVGTYYQYFSAGTIKGKFDLVPQESPPLSSTSFATESFKGTVSVTGGTGSLKGTKSTKAGVMKCTSPDTVHLTCTETVKVTP